MDCSLIQCDFALFHAGAMSDVDSQRIDAHLVACGACLRAYLAFKRHVESKRERPSEKARLRLRASVAAEFRPTIATRVYAWVRKPIPLYQGVAAAALVLIAVLAAPLFSSRHPQRQLKPGGEHIDTSRQRGATEGVL